MTTLKKSLKKNLKKSLKKSLKKASGKQNKSMRGGAWGKLKLGKQGFGPGGSKRPPPTVQPQSTYSPQPRTVPLPLKPPTRRQLQESTRALRERLQVQREILAQRKLTQVLPSQ